MWKSGVSEYPNHYLMKQNRLIKLQQTKAKCEICGERGVQIHHKDGSKNNHNLKNLILLCHYCHTTIDLKTGSGNGHTTKYIRKYGMTLKEMAQKLHTCETTIWKWHQKKILQAQLNSLDNK
jgi:hypothetical protein